MSTELDLINSLGLGATETPADAAVVTPDEAANTAAAQTTKNASDDQEAATAPAKREAIKIKGDIKTGTATLLPARAAFGGGGGKRGSKYPFEDLAAPTKDEAGNVTGYSFFEVKLADVENADAKKLRSAIQAAVAAQNAENKKNNVTTKYVTRTLIEDGAYVGSAVYRVDDTIEEDDAE